MKSTLYFQFATRESANKFIADAKKMLESFVYSLTILNEGRALRISIEGTRTNIIWETKGRYFYMN